MSKIQTIRIKNFKSISDLEANFNGCTAIVTGGNNKGKTSFLKGIVERIRFVRPDVMVKQGEKEGLGELILDTGERFLWEFDFNKDKLTYITSEGRKSVTKEFGAKFFPPVFDIDKFLQSQPKEQVRQLQSIVGLDFTEIDARYKKAYDIRTERNREAELYRAKLQKIMQTEPVDEIDILDLQAKKQKLKNELNALYLENKQKNLEARKAWEAEKELIVLQCNEHNQNQAKKKAVFDECFRASLTLKSAGFDGDIEKFLDSLRNQLKPEMIPGDLFPKEPTYIDEIPDRSELDKIDAELLAAAENNAKAQKYKEYLLHKKETEAALELAKEADNAVKSIEQEKKKMIECANFPKGIEVNADGITVDGLPLDRNQISTSKLYCAALRIASMNLGEVKTLYFDASFLDKNTLSEIQTWATENDLQLLIERPDFDGGEIKYTLIED